MSRRTVGLPVMIVGLSACALFVVACSLLLDTEGLTSPKPGSDSSVADAMGGRDDASNPKDDGAPSSPSIGLGNGSGGAVTLDNPATLNAYFTLAADVPVGSRVLTLNEAVGLSVGDVVLVWQVGASDGVPADDVDVQLTGRVGSYELARITKTADATLEVDRDLGGYAAARSQVVAVPQLTELTVRASGSVVPKTWDGRVGGIVAVLVSGTLNNDGVISADGAGFRGSPPGPSAGSFFLCAAALEGPLDAGYAPRGEGLHLAAYGAASPSGGRGNLLNGGGGGNCHNAGGGGGGQGSAGGQGGRGFPPVSIAGDIGGLGGARLGYTLRERFSLGGGGGGGDSDNGLRSEGARGGGVIFLRARALSGAGTIRTNGATPPTIGDDGAGGGGAGGAILLQVVTSATCTIGALGGAGGSQSTATVMGPGGGGGGGHVLLQAASATCPINVASGIAGTNVGATDAGSPNFGATPAASEQGIIEVSGSGYVP